MAGSCVEERRIRMNETTMTPLGWVHGQEGFRDESGLGQPRQERDKTTKRRPALPLTCI